MHDTEIRAQNMNKVRIYFCYSRHSPKIYLIQRLSQVLKEIGYIVFDPKKHNIPGSSLEETRRREIQASDIVLIFLDSTINKAKNINQELQFADEMATPIVPFLVEDDIHSNEYPSDNTMSQAIWMSHWQVYRSIEETESVIETINYVKWDVLRRKSSHLSLPSASIIERIQQVFFPQSKKIYTHHQDNEETKTLLVERGLIAKFESVFGTHSLAGKFQCDAFMIMPFREHLDAVYTDHIKPVVEEVGLKIIRGDDPFSDKEIMSEIWSMINNARFIIADCTERNPNVFYELGIAHTLGKTVIMITQNIDDIPFDLKGKRAIEYKPTEDGMKYLRENLRDTIDIVLEEYRI